MLGILLERYPQRRIVMRQSAPRGNCQRMDSRVDQPKVLTMRGPKAETAPFTGRGVRVIFFVSLRMGLEGMCTCVSETHH